MQIVTRYRVAVSIFQGTGEQGAAGHRTLFIEKSAETGAREARKKKKQKWSTRSRAKRGNCGEFGPNPRPKTTIPQATKYDDIVEIDRKSSPFYFGKRIPF